LLTAVSFAQRAFRVEVSFFIDWYNDQRPHMTLQGATPNEVYFRRRPSQLRSTRGTPCRLSSWLTMNWMSPSSTAADTFPA
jgi:hypothetical protein